MNTNSTPIRYESQNRISQRLDLVFHGLSLLAAITVVGLATWLLVDLFTAVGSFQFRFLTELPRDGGRAGGIRSVLVSTSLILFICLAVAIPLAVGSAIYLSEFVDPRSRLVRFVEASVMLLSSIPSVVFGLFGLVLFCRLMGLGITILSGGLTLACMVLPLLFAVVFSGLRSLPDHLRRSATAAGLSKTTMIVQLLLPAIRTPVLIGTVLATARALSETAALLFTSGYATRMPESVFDSGRSISVHIFDLAANQHGGQTNAKLSALVLLVILIIFNALAIRFMSNHRTNWTGGR